MDEFVFDENVNITAWKAFSRNDLQEKASYNFEGIQEWLVRWYTFLRKDFFA